MSKKKNKSGFSLIEVMVAMLVLLVLMVGGAMVLYTTSADIQIYGNKRVAMERARTQLEVLQAKDYKTLSAEAKAGNPQTGSRSETWKGIPIAINWTNQWVSTGGILTNEYIQLYVSASFSGTDERVLLQAHKANTP